VKVTSKKLYQRIAASIVDAIQSGQYRQGARLPGERDLAELYKVSRPTIREAMIALEMLGWIEARHGSGLYVSKTTPGPSREESLELDIGAFDLTEARIVFEGEAASLAAHSITQEELAELDAIVDEMGAAHARPEAIDADRRFHIAVAAATDNAAIRSVVEYLWEVRIKSPLCVAIFDRAEMGGVNPKADEHRAIVIALRAADPDAARAAMHAHLRGVANDLLAATENQVMTRAREEIDATRSKMTRRLKLAVG
jgi:GntR family transcriptional repressor for pyruvate dehydrogenase complex